MRRKPWQRIPEAEVTPENVFLQRREILKGLGLTAGSLAIGSGGLLAGVLAAGNSEHIPLAWVEKWARLFPAIRNRRFVVDRDLTDEGLFTSYNNFYEFSLAKEKVKNLVADFEAHPWQIEIAGEVEKKGTFDLDDIIRMGKLEERIYHFRCVEAWSANVPWTGFPFSQLIDKLKPTSDARFVRFVTVLRPSQMPNQKMGQGYPWPYYEALTMEEARNELALLTFGVYGHPLNLQNGAPVRMILPWKFGFKSIKSIVRIEFLRKQPGTFWSDISREYGFYGNINPRFSHPRWSQANETFLNTRERIPTRIYNGYAEFVGSLYDENDRKYFY